MSFWGHEALASIDAETAAAEIEAGAQLVDIGEPEEWYAGHLPHALLLEPELIDRALTELSKDKPVVVASRNPDLAAGAAASLHDHGFQVAILAGGPHAWAASGRPLMRLDGK
jgi:rhodanese-related sulfurtransferase